jgi:hypothetical protein
MSACVPSTRCVKHEALARASSPSAAFQTPQPCEGIPTGNALHVLTVDLAELGAVPTICSDEIHHERRDCDHAEEPQAKPLPQQGDSCCQHGHGKELRMANDRIKASVYHHSRVGEDVALCHTATPLELHNGHYQEHHRHKTQQGAEDEQRADSAHSAYEEQYQLTCDQ